MSATNVLSFRMPVSRSACTSPDAATAHVRPVLLNLDQSAAYLTVTPGVIRGQRYRDSFPDPVFIGKKMRWDTRDLDAWIDDKRAAAKRGAA